METPEDIIPVMQKDLARARTLAAPSRTSGFSPSWYTFLRISLPGAIFRCRSKAS